MKQLIDGKEVDMTAEEIAEKNQKEKDWNDKEFERSMYTLRKERNKLLTDTDYLALSDQTLTDEMKKYRQDLRDLTNGLTTKAEVDAVTFPTKPEW